MSDGGGFRSRGGPRGRSDNRGQRGSRRGYQGRDARHGYYNPWRGSSLNLINTIPEEEEKKRKNPQRCFDFSSPRGCTRGDACQWSHEMEEDMLKYCGTCRKWGKHRTFECEDTKCRRCGEKGHVERNCPKLNQMVLNGEITGTRSKERPYFEAEIGGYGVICGLDTGCEGSDGVLPLHMAKVLEKRGLRAKTSKRGDEATRGTDPEDSGNDEVGGDPNVPEFRENS